MVFVTSFSYEQFWNFFHGMASYYLFDVFELSLI